MSRLSVVGAIVRFYGIFNDKPGFTPAAECRTEDATMLRAQMIRTLVVLALTGINGVQANAEANAGATAQEDSWHCPQNAEGVTDNVRALLSADFHAGEDGASLDASFRELEILTLRSGHCSAAARSTGRKTPGRDTNIEEWHAINQWLSRLVNIMGLNVRGDHRRTWRDEYALFAEVYEFEP